MIVLKKEKNDKFTEYLSSSFFISILNKISDFLYSKIVSSQTAKFFTSFDSIELKGEESLFRKIVGFIKPKSKTILRLKNTFAGKIERSFFYSLYKKLINSLLGTKARSYGSFFFVYGIFSSLIGLIEHYLIFDKEGMSLVFQGIVVAIVSIPLLFSKERVGVLLSDGKIGKFVLSFLDLDKDSVKKHIGNDNTVIPIILALLFGLLTPLISPLLLLFGASLIVVLFLVFHKPEVGVLATVALLPFLPTMLICGEIFIVWVAYLLKLLRGKRTFKLGVLDLFVLMFSVYFFLGGVFSVSPSDSLPPACVFLTFISFYFVVINLVRTTDFVKKILFSSSVSLFICSIYGIYQNFFAAPDTTWTDEDMFSEIETRVVSTFENPNVFGEYLILLLPIVITFLVVSKQPYKRAFSFACLAASVMALVYTWSRGAWLGAIASMFIFLVIINRRAIAFYLTGIFAVPFAIPFLPSSIIERFTSIGNMTDSSTSYRVFIWEASVGMIKDYFFSGIGVGSVAFQTVYSEYALAGIETAPHSHNLYLQILVELGVFGFLIFLISIFMLFSKAFTFLKKSEDKDSKIIVGALLCGIIAFLVQGLTDYVWYNYRVFALFWMLIAVCVATVKVASFEMLDQNDMILKGGKNNE